MYKEPQSGDLLCEVSTHRYEDEEKWMITDIDKN